MKPIVTFDVHRLLNPLWLSFGLIVLLSCAVRLFAPLAGVAVPPALSRFFDLDGEYNLPAFFSAFLMGMIALTCSVIRQLDDMGRRSYWTVLWLGFLLMSIDEICSFHERLAAPIRSLWKVGEWPMLHFAWILPGGTLVAVLGLYFGRFLIRLPRRHAKAFVIAGACFVGGCIGVEFFEGWHVALHGRHNITYGMLSNAEESMELAGLILFLKAIWHYMAAIAPEWSVRVSTPVRVDRPDPVIGIDRQPAHL